MYYLYSYFFAVWSDSGSFETDTSFFPHFFSILPLLFFDFSPPPRSVGTTADAIRFSKPALSSTYSGQPAKENRRCNPTFKTSFIFLLLRNNREGKPPMQSDFQNQLCLPTYSGQPAKGKPPMQSNFQNQLYLPTYSGQPTKGKPPMQSNFQNQLYLLPTQEQPRRKTADAIQQKKRQRFHAALFV